MVDSIEQITYRLFLKMADERGIDLSAPPYEEQEDEGRRRKRKKDCWWPALRTQFGVDLTDHNAESLRILGEQTGIGGRGVGRTAVEKDWRGFGRGRLRRLLAAGAGVFGGPCVIP